jgi:hypothetical protein
MLVFKGGSTTIIGFLRGSTHKINYIYYVVTKFSDESGGSDPRTSPLDPPMKLISYWYIS